MAFVGKDMGPDTVLFFDQGRLRSENKNKIVNMQAAYEGGARAVLGNGSITFESMESTSTPKIRLVHKSSYGSSRGILFETGDDLSVSESWMPLEAQDALGAPVFSVGVRTGGGTVSVRSDAADGDSGYQFSNELGTLIALDTGGASSVMVFQKSEGYFDFRGAGDELPTLRIDPTGDNPTVSIGQLGTENLLLVNGMDLTQYSGSVVVPAGSTSDYTILDLGTYIEEDTYGMFNVDIFAGTLETPDVEDSATGAWKYFITVNKKLDGLRVVGVTQLEIHWFIGTGSSDDPRLWGTDVTQSGTVIVNTKRYNSLRDVSFGAVITKLSVLDTLNGHMLR
jgi:hypothetical protein